MRITKSLISFSLQPLEYQAKRMVPKERLPSNATPGIGTPGTGRDEQMYNADVLLNNTQNITTPNANDSEYSGQIQEQGNSSDEKSDAGTVSSDPHCIIPTKYITIETRGDLKLIVGDDNVCFLVCSKTLARSGRYWEAMLYGNFAEAKQANSKEWIVKVEEDHADAFHVLLLLVHGQMYKLPSLNVDLRLAFDVTVLADKYQLKRCLWGIADVWLDDLRPSGPNYTSLWIPPLEWLWMTQELGDLEQYRVAFQRLALRTEIFHGLETAYEDEEAGGRQLPAARWGEVMSEHGKLVLRNVEGGSTLTEYFCHFKVRKLIDS